ncbi:MAG: hypothetical protein K9J16_07905 [Melioribacteraceae bacterium]|nr:hypothetical protein [Melioribacteraceae bacterium]MCF8353355.1 hypothetical protein [Melioribacteraceae bacterium]MCF8393219.1 hypothetical protein [Melioribacteraceae bacterium]MCF8419081.1 hypothetical protein [Melioribacteraceae bacterium]
MKRNITFLIFATVLFLSYFLINEINNQQTQHVISPAKNFSGPDTRPNEWAWMQRTFPHFDADPRATLEAVQQTQKMKKELRQIRKGVSFPGWEFAGPINIGGRVVDIEFNPAEPNIVYAAAATGGVFKSTDTGETWFPIFDDQPTQTIGDIGIDPVNPDIIYVGTGEPNGGHNNFPGSGMFKSTDAGISWEHIGLDSSVSIGRVVINPNNPDIIYVAAVGSYFAPNPERGLYKSTDAGATWEKSLFISDSTGAIDIVMDPTDPDFLMVSMWERVRRPNSSHLYGPTSGIFRTTDAGTNWEELGTENGLPNPAATNIGRIGLSISKSNPNIAYALYTDGYTYHGFYKTDDYGDTWSDADTDNEIDFGTSTFSWYFGQVRVHPADPNTVFAMDVSFMKSTNAGASWPIEYGYGGPSQLHVDHHALAFHPENPEYLISGNDGGMNISTNGGVTWSNPVQLPATQFYEIGLDANNPERLYGGTQDNSSLRTSTGNLDDWFVILGGDGFYNLVDHEDPNIVYAEYQNGGLNKLVFSGESWNTYYALNGVNSSDPRNWSTPVAMDPNNSSILYYGTNKIYRTTNKADSWTAVSGILVGDHPRLGTITTIAVAPSNSNVIYAGTDDSHVWVSDNYGSTWRVISNGLPERWVTRVVVDPSKDSTLYVTFSGLKWRDPQPHVFASTNMGESWTNISGNLPDAPVNAFAVDNNYPDRLYLGNDVGMFISFDGGRRWDSMGENFPVVVVGDIKIHPTENYLAVGTHGRSMYKMDLDAITNIDEDVDRTVAGDFKLYQNYPNPFNPTTKIKYTIPTVERNAVSLKKNKQFGELSYNVSLRIYSMLGEEITTLVNEAKQPGTYEVEFNGAELPSGVYLYRLNAGDYSGIKKMLILK